MAESNQSRDVPVGHVDFGELRRVTPVARNFGFGRGLPVDRYYIERFIRHHGADIRGVVLEIADDNYTRKFGREQVQRIDVLSVSPKTAPATIVADLVAAPHIPDASFDCIICTQTLQYIYDLRAAAATLYRILKPGGVLLATCPGISQIDDAAWAGTWYWNLTPVSARRLFEEAFGAEVKVEAHGNVLTSMAFLQGLAAEELAADELDVDDPAYPAVVTIRAVKKGTSGPSQSNDLRSIDLPACHRQTQNSGNVPVLRLVIVASREAYLRHASLTRGEISLRVAYEDALCSVDNNRFTVRGHCYWCGVASAMWVDYDHGYELRGRLTPNWRESLRCERCGASNRHRAAIHILEGIVGAEPLDIYLTEQTTPLHDRITARYPRTVGSEYLGSERTLEPRFQSLRHEDITRLSFAADSFDVVLSFDVLEHVPLFREGLREVYRVLRPGGQFLFSVPFDLNSELTLIRAKVNPDGSVDHLLEPELHVDPMAAQGILCFQNFGWDLFDDLRTAGFPRPEALLYWSSELAYLGGEQVLFRAAKPIRAGPPISV